MNNRKDTYLFRLVDGTEVVFVGLTRDPAGTRRTLVSNGLRFSVMDIFSDPLSPGKARRMLDETLEHYTALHGVTPRYNRPDKGTRKKESGKKKKRG